jgi:hypothetical protein
MIPSNSVPFHYFASFSPLSMHFLWPDIPCNAPRNAKSSHAFPRTGIRFQGTSVIPVRVMVFFFSASLFVTGSRCHRESHVWRFTSNARSQITDLQRPFCPLILGKFSFWQMMLCRASVRGCKMDADAIGLKPSDASRKHLYDGVLNRRNRVLKLVPLSSLTLRACFHGVQNEYLC